VTSVLDRRGPHRGDQRRAALLRALDELLRDGTLDSINIAEITTRNVPRKREVPPISR